MFHTFSFYHIHLIQLSSIWVHYINLQKVWVKYNIDKKGNYNEDKNLPKFGNLGRIGIRRQSLHQADNPFLADIDAVFLGELRLDSPVAVKWAFSKNFVDSVHNLNVFRIDGRLVVNT